MKHIGIIFLSFMLAFSSSCSGKTNDSQSPVKEDSSNSVEKLADEPLNIHEAESIASASESKAKTEEGKVYTKLVNNGKPTVIDFTATWCGPCKMMKPIFHKLSAQFGDKINFVSIDIDENPDLANKYQVQAVPTFVFLDEDGKEGNRITGADPEKLSKDIADGMWY